MGHADNKAARLLQVEALLLAHPEGLTQSDIARRLSVNRSTVGRYIPDLPAHIYIDDLDDNRWKIDRDGYLVNVRLTMHEALSLHLAARLMTAGADKQNPHAAAVLRKLGISMERLAPLIAKHLKQSADVMDDQAQRHDPVYLEVLETLTRAWSTRRKVRLWHQHDGGKIYDYDFAPYFIEPYAVGRATHVIGWREPPGAQHTFKVERIRRIEMLADAYVIPEDFDPRSLLADAWGIWYTEAEPVEVVLRFHPRVARRVQETQWHRSETLEEQADGSLLWRAKIAEPQEMMHWIRGWSADVTVMEPKELRETLTGEAKSLAEHYEWFVSSNATDPSSTLNDFFGGA